MPGVLVAYISPLSVSARFTQSLTALIDHDFQGSRHIVGSVSLISGPRIAEARSQVVDHFGQHPSDPDWLLCLDADMVFQPDLVDRLMEFADPNSVPVLGGLCFAGVHGGASYPTLYRSWNDDDGHVSIEPVEDYPADALVKVAATGAACLLVHRRVFAACRRPGPAPGETWDPKRHGFGTLADGQENPYPWFEEGRKTSRGIALGEDIAFARKLGLLNIPIHVHTGIKVGHEKSFVLTDGSYDMYLREKRRPGPLLDGAMQVLRESGRFAPDELNDIAEYLRPRDALLGYDERPKPKPFLLPEPVSVPS